MLHVAAAVTAGDAVDAAADPQAPVSLLVSRADAPDLYDISDADLVSVGPFTGTGLDMRSSGVQAAFRCAVSNQQWHNRYRYIFRETMPLDQN
jgi:hypothetical protein